MTFRSKESHSEYNKVRLVYSEIMMAADAQRVQPSASNPAPCESGTDICARERASNPTTNTLTCRLSELNFCLGLRFFISHKSVCYQREHFFLPPDVV